MNVSYCRRPQPTPLLFNVIRHTMTVTSICLTILCVFIVNRSSSVTRTYSKLLMLLLIGATCLDVFIQWIYDPVFLLPRICVYRNAPLINFPFSARFGHSAMQSLIASGGPIYIALFLYRHQHDIDNINSGSDFSLGTAAEEETYALWALLLPGSRFKLSKNKQIAFILFLLLPYSSMGISVYIGMIAKSNKEEYVERMSKEWDPQIMARVDCFAMDKMYLYWAYGCILPTFITFFLVAIARHTFAMLRRVSHISKRMQEKHRILTRSLIVQALLPVIIVIIPFGAMMIFTTGVFYIMPSIYDTIETNPADYTILCISFHATAHCIALIWTTPAFRKTLAELTFRRQERIVPTTTASSSAFTSS